MNIIYISVYLYVNELKKADNGYNKCQDQFSAQNHKDIFNAKVTLLYYYIPSGHTLVQKKI